MDPKSCYLDLQEKVQFLSGTLEKNADLALSISALQAEIECLNVKVRDSRLERNNIIGKSFIRISAQSPDSDLEKTKESLENLLVRSKQDFGSLSEKVLESEDLIQYYIDACRACDIKETIYKKELEKIKVITPPMHISESFAQVSSLKRPIQLNSGRILKKSESVGSSQLPKKT